MTVCQLIQYFEVGGIERMVLALARGAADAGIRTVVVAYSSDGPFRAAFTDVGIATRFLPSRAGLKPDLVFNLARLLRRERVNVIHTHHVGPFIYGGAAAALTRTGHVHTEHSRELYDTPRRRAVGRTMPRLATVVTVAPELSEWRATEFGDEPEVIRNGVLVPPPVTDDARQAARSALGLPVEGTLIACVARLGAEKDHLTLLEGVAGLTPHHPDLHLVLAGDGDQRAAIEARAARPDLVGRVHLLGSVRDVERVYQAADVAALTSTREGLPLALLEAMGHGIPVVASAVGGIPDLLRSGGGRLSQPSDPVSVTTALAHYLADPDERRADGRAARALVDAHYSERAMVDRYLELYRSQSR